MSVAFGVRSFSSITSSLRGERGQGKVIQLITNYRGGGVGEL